jgi:hypothetical protein
MQKISAQTLNDFSRYFKGSDTAHGCHQYEEGTDKKGKRSGKSWTETKPVMDKDYKAHLEGIKGLGIIPIDSNSKVQFCVIDIDDYTKKTDEYVNLIYSNNMPLVPFRSKSGGLHLYIFFAVPVMAASAIDIMTNFLSLLALSSKTEIFPKQKKVRVGDHGNWINLPYFNRGDAFEGKMKGGLEDETGSILPVETAIIEIKKKLQTKESVKDFFESLPLKDAPPCLQTIYLSGDTHHRNDYLFNLACYFKSKHGDDFENKVMEANMMLVDPLSAKEISSTITKNKSKEYTYKCSQEPICTLCNKTECSKREFGIEGDRISQLNFEEFIQYQTQPPYYVWNVNGKGLKFFKETDIIKQEKFRELCVRELHILPNRLKDITWTRIVNGALSNIIIREVDPEDDISPGAEFNSHLTEFLERRAHAQSKEQILLDRVYKDLVRKQYVFKSKDLLTYLINTKGFRHFGSTEIQDRLRTMKGAPARYYLGKSYGTIRVWTVPFEALRNFKEEASIENFTIDFSEKYEDSAF